MTVPQRSLYCFGLGYSAMVLARRLVGAGWRVGGTVRTPGKAVELRAEGIHAQLFEGEGQISPPDSDVWLVSVPPGVAGCPVAAALGGPVPTHVRVIYLSTTGVYGDLGGGWTVEWGALNPQSDRAKRRVLAEQQWAGLTDRLYIIRLPGIYGPGRSVFDKLRTGEARSILKPRQVFSRVHVNDISGALGALIGTKNAAPGAYNLADDMPAPTQHVNAFAAKVAGLPVPREVPLDDAEVSTMARSFYDECKRVPNAKLKAATGWRPQYPSYCEGLQAIWDAETGGRV